jgi:hypothetical protein
LCIRESCEQFSDNGVIHNTKRSLVPYIKGRTRLRVCENRVLRRDEVTSGWRKLHNEEFHDLYSSPSIITIIKSRKMKWMGCVTQME